MSLLTQYKTAKKRYNNENKAYRSSPIVTTRMGPLLTFKHRIVTENYRKANANLEKIKKQIKASNENIERAIKELKKLRKREMGIKY
jgi:hypothetical protein